MASLAITTEEILRMIGLVAGINRDAAEWDETMELDARNVIREGFRDFLHPIDAQSGSAYTWKFLEKSATFIGVAAVDDSTITVVDGVATLAAGSWPTWAADGIIEIGEGTDSVGRAFVASRDSATQITLDNTSIDAAAGTTYTLYRYKYTLPSLFGEFIGGVLVADGSNRGRRLTPVTDAELRLRHITGLRQGQTCQYTIQAEGSNPATSNWYIQFWPVLDENAIAYGTYKAQLEDGLEANLIDALDTIQMPTQHAQTLMEAVLAAAERYFAAPGPHAARFDQCLQRSIKFDGATPGPIGGGPHHPDADPRRIALYTHVPDYSGQTS
jgi:hypothetical protein